ncbi:MAG: hypothetical protein HFH36_03530 [Lachnospiraceae bacterium]|nr:hypothetical protein [Lachnospiraceae bacterium]
MRQEEKLLIYKECAGIAPREEKIQEAVNRSKQVFFAAERERLLTYHEFLWAQLKTIRKRWWILQFLLLLALWAALAAGQEERYMQRGMGVMASLFVILVIPELWRNRSSQSMEIEAVSYYSLRQVYAGRMLLFGIADICLVAVFCQAATRGLNLAIAELVSQFLFPLSVTACICFGALCSRRCINEASAIALCVVWSAVWLFVVWNEGIYARVALPVWILLLGLAIACLAAMICRTLKSCDEYMEVTLDGIEI